MPRNSTFLSRTRTHFRSASERLADANRAMLLPRALHARCTASNAVLSRGVGIYLRNCLEVALGEGEPRTRENRENFNASISFAERARVTHAMKRFETR